MDTTTTPFFARCSPSCRASEVPPSVYPPPKIQIMTGNFAFFTFFAEAGVHTLSVRQSSLWPGSRNAISVKNAGCMHREPNEVAVRVPFHLAAGTGAFHRRVPTGGSA